MTRTFLTPQGHEKLLQELDHLRNVRRREVAERLRDAIDDGDRLGEDAEYEAAKNEQAFVEGRIRELEVLLAQARIIVPEGKREAAQVGAKVTIQEEGTAPETYTIVGAAEANPRLGLISNESPLGRALLDHRINEKVTVKAPAGVFTVTILKVE